MPKGVRSYAYSLADLLMKEGQFTPAGTVLRSVIRHTPSHALLDALYAKWLWCEGKRKQAQAFAGKRQVSRQVSVLTIYTTPQRVRNLQRSTRPGAEFLYGL